jgi:hypothetical protein
MFLVWFGSSAVLVADSVISICLMGGETLGSNYFVLLLLLLCVCQGCKRRVESKAIL